MDGPAGGDTVLVEPAPRQGGPAGAGDRAHPGTTMEMGGTLRVLGRRRWVLLVGLLAVVGAVGYAATSAKPQYTATADVLLTAPAANPYLDVAQQLDVLARSTAAEDSDQATSTRLAAAGATSLYTISLDEVNHTALFIQATDRDAATAVRTILAVERQIQTTLLARQAQLRVPAAATISSRPLADPVVQGFNKTRNRLLLVAGGGAIAGTVVVAYLLEGLDRRRRAYHQLDPLARLALRSRVLRRGVSGGLILVVLLAGAAYVVKKPPPWQASTTLELIPPQFPPNPNVAPSKRGTLNPFQSFDSSFDIVSSLATQRASAASARATLGAQGFLSSYAIVNYTIGANPVDTSGNPTPLLEVVVTSSDPAAAERTVSAVADLLTSEVNDLQASIGAPSSTWISTAVVSPPAAAQLHTSRTRALAALGVLALVAAIAAARVLDGLLARTLEARHRLEERRWQRRRAAAERRELAAAAEAQEATQPQPAAPEPEPIPAAQAPTRQRGARMPVMALMSLAVAIATDLAERFSRRQQR